LRLDKLYQLDKLYKFAAASESEPIVFGAARPSYSNVPAWIECMQHHRIQHVCCLLPSDQRARYTNLLDTYRQTFGQGQVCWAPIPDFDLATPEVLFQQILPFLAAANHKQEKVVVHCSGGIGRTGHVLAAWLVAARGFSPQAAIAAVQKTGRNPYEAVIAAPFRFQNPWQVAVALNALLEASQQWREV
jgi:protein-tyrosine phosphatase